MAGADARERFIARLRAAARDGCLRRVRLNRPVAGSVAEADLLRIDARPVRLKGGPVLSLVWHYRTRDETHNRPVDEAIDWIAGQLGSGFAAAVLTTDRDEVELGFSRKGRALLRSRMLTGPDGSARGDDRPAAEHNRRKPRWLDPGRPFLAALGISDDQGRIIPAMARKWRQIDRFVEIFVGAWRDAALDPAIGTAGRPIRIVDLGAGKGYLTFALHDYLTGQGHAVHITGVERRPDLVQAGNRTARALGCDGLDFVAGDILASAAPGDGSAWFAEPIDVMIALHACDTATDDALFRGLSAGAAILICSPCCHKELRPQLLTPHPLRPLLKHGIQRGELADMLTDTMRALLLEARGYDARIFEFVSLEHTARNRMILAVRGNARAGVQHTDNDGADGAVAYDELAALKAFHGIRHQRLEGLLTGQAPLTGAQ